MIYVDETEPDGGMIFLSHFYQIWIIYMKLISREIRPLAALYPPPPYKVLSVVAGGVMFMPTAFAPLYIVSV